MRVLKFGGTSVGDAERIRGVAAIVRERAARGPVVLVVSAQAGVTNHLIDLASRAAKAAVEPTDLRRRLTGLLEDLGLEDYLVDEEMDELATLLRGITLVGDLTPRSLDRMMSFGERASVRIVAAALAAGGTPAAASADGASAGAGGGRSEFQMSRMMSHLPSMFCWTSM